MGEVKREDGGVAGRCTVEIGYEDMCVGYWVYEDMCVEYWVYEDVCMCACACVYR